VLHCFDELHVRLVSLQEQGLDTVDANRALGLPDDCREYTSVRNILRDLGVRSVRLMVRVSWSSMCGVRHVM
jgi:GTP cyclohydrolase II